MQGRELRGELDAFLAETEQDLVAFRRDLHMHPELAFAEYRTTQRIAERLLAVGLVPTVLPRGTGLICDVGSGDGPIVALRADIDALPLQDEKELPYRSTVAGSCHGDRDGRDLDPSSTPGSERQARASPRIRAVFGVARPGPQGARGLAGDGPASRSGALLHALAQRCEPRSDPES